jgi:hypothetical protein
MRSYRDEVREVLVPLVERYCPTLGRAAETELKKMLELSAKMTMVGHACSEVAGYPFDRHRKTLSAFYGGCCFLADSFIDDYGEAIARDYIERFELLLTRGWFEIRNEREELFYVILSRLFMRRNTLVPMVRQAIFSLFEAQKRDIMLRLGARSFRQLPRRAQLLLLRQCARDRSGHGILVLAHFAAPRLRLHLHHLLFLSGALIMFIDDHGDCYADRRCKRITYMNQVKHPRGALQAIYAGTMQRLAIELPDNSGKRLLCAFLFRYFVTRIEKHEREREKGGLSWAVYE